MEERRHVMKTIDHLNRYVSDVDKFIDFYRNALDYALIDRGTKSNGKRYAILKGGGHELFISESDLFAIETVKNFRHIGYHVDDVDEWLDTLKSKGYAHKSQEIIIKPFSKQFYLKDPDGFEIDFIQWTDKQGFYRYLRDKNSTCQ